MLRKIISGGQTGADQGGLCAGKLLGLEIGGTAPPNFMTHDGPNPMLLKYAFGLEEGEHDSRTYPKRTRKNVKDSDGTVIFGRLSSPGSRSTIRYCEAIHLPFITNPTSVQLRMWAESCEIEVLNVAGNREHKNPGICDRVIKTLLEAFNDKSSN